MNKEEERSKTEETKKTEEEKDYSENKEPKEENNDARSEKVTKKTILKENRQTIFLIIFILLAFAAFLIPFFYVQNTKIFDYKGVTWQVEKDGEVTFYHTQFTKRIGDKEYGRHNTYFRNDPRKNNIPIEVTDLAFHKNIILTQDPDILRCEKQILATDAIGQMTLALPNYDKRFTSALTDEEQANRTNNPHFTCENKPEKSTLIHIRKGEESRITEDKDKKCYTITIKDCSENIKATERFILEVISQLNGQ